jgi:hypothetical protein
MMGRRRRQSLPDSRLARDPAMCGNFRRRRCNWQLLVLQLYSRASDEYAQWPDWLAAVKGDGGERPLLEPLC